MSEPQQNNFITSVKIIGGFCFVFDGKKKHWLGEIDLSYLEIHKKLQELGFNLFENRQMVIEKIKEYKEKQEKKEKPKRILVEERMAVDFDQNVEKNLLNYLDLIKIVDNFVHEIGIYYDNARNWWIWNKTKTCWQLVDETDILNIVDSHIQFASETLKSNIKNEILEALKRAGRLNKPKELKPTQVQFVDTIIDVATFEKILATNEYFAVNPIPYPLGEEIETPVIDGLFEQWVGKEKTPLLYELVAFCLSSEYFIHRVICLTGSGSNGKSLFLRFIKKFVGSYNITSTELDVLIESAFESSKLYTKLACFMGETNFATMKKTSRLKQLTGQDTMTVQFKHKPLFDMVNYAKIFIATNSLPTTDDKTKGFYRRWLIIDFPNEFVEANGVLEQIPEHEYNNLAYKCVKILGSLLKTCKFSQEGSIEDRAKAYEEHSNPVSKFVQENYVKDINARTPHYQFYDKLMTYLQEKGQRTLSKKAVSSILEEAGFELKRETVPRQDGTTTTWVFIYGLKEREGLFKFENQSGTIEQKKLDKLDKPDVPLSPLYKGESETAGLSSLLGLGNAKVQDVPVITGDDVLCSETPSNEEKNTEKNTECDIISGDFCGSCSIQTNSLFFVKNRWLCRKCVVEELGAKYEKVDKN